MRILFSAYRVDQYSDPDGYLTSLGLVLEDYPNDVIVYVTDPRSGMQRHLKWPPTISEIVEACNDRMADLARQERFRNWGKSETLLLDPPEQSKPTLDELKAKHGPNWGINVEDPEAKPKAQAPVWEQVIASYAAQPTRVAKLIEIIDRHREASIPSKEAAE
jgi:hypothetical protein